eukprot:2184942-Pyramimonas_sp.AAC.1
MILYTISVQIDYLRHARALHTKLITHTSPTGEDMRPGESVPFAAPGGSLPVESGQTLQARSQIQIPAKRHCWTAYPTSPFSPRISCLYAP